MVTQAARKGGFFLRVLVVTETYPPEVNGVALTVQGYVNGLKSRGVDVHLLRPRLKGERGASTDSSLHLVGAMRIPQYPLLQIGLPWPTQLRGLLRELSPDAIYIATEGPLGLATLRAAHKEGVPTATGYHTNFDQYMAHYGVGWLRGIAASYLRWFHNRATSTLVGTDELRDDLSKRGYTNVRYQPRGVDTEMFTPERRKDALRTEWGAGPETPVLICVGRLAAEKNIDLVVRGWQAFRAICPEAILVLVGDGPLRGELEKSHPDIVFSGMQTGEQLAAHYASADILLFPSVTETFGNITVEGLASGLALVAYDYAAARQHIIDGHNGLLAPFGDEVAYMQAVERLAQHPSLVASLREMARITAESITPERVHSELEDLLREHAARPAIV